MKDFKEKKNMKTIYKKDSKGKIRYLTISTEGNLLVQTSGLMDTISPVINKSVCEPKNVGRSNATTAEEQAISEANSKITEKLKTGYFNTIAEAESEGGKDFLLPMLAKDYNKEKAKVKFPCWVQPKLDGMRMLAIKKGGKVVLKSRKGETINTLEHIVKQLEENSFPDGVYDGEAFSLELGSFQNQMKAIKTINDNTKKINYNIYDIVSDLPFSERTENLRNIFSL